MPEIAWCQSFYVLLLLSCHVLLLKDFSVCPYITFEGKSKTIFYMSSFVNISKNLTKKHPPFSKRVLRCQLNSFTDPAQSPTSGVSHDPVMMSVSSNTSTSIFSSSYSCISKLLHYLTEVSVCCLVVKIQALEHSYDIRFARIILIGLQIYVNIT